MSASGRDLGSLGGCFGGAFRGLPAPPSQEGLAALEVEEKGSLRGVPRSDLGGFGLHFGSNWEAFENYFGSILETCC